MAFESMTCHWMEVLKSGERGAWLGWPLVDHPPGAPTTHLLGINYAKWGSAVTHVALSGAQNSNEIGKLIFHIWLQEKQMVEKNTFFWLKRTEIILPIGEMGENPNDTKNVEIKPMIKARGWFEMEVSEPLMNDHWSLGVRIPRQNQTYLNGVLGQFGPLDLVMQMGEKTRILIHHISNWLHPSSSFHLSPYNSYIRGRAPAISYMTKSRWQHWSKGVSNALNTMRKWKCVHVYNLLMVFI